MHVPCKRLVRRTKRGMKMYTIRFFVLVLTFTISAFGMAHAEGLYEMAFKGAIAGSDVLTFTEKEKDDITRTLSYAIRGELARADRVLLLVKKGKKDDPDTIAECRITRTFINHFIGYIHMTSTGVIGTPHEQKNDAVAHLLFKARDELQEICGLR